MSFEDDVREMVRTKRGNYILYRNGFYGNRPRLWESLEDLENSDYRGEVTIRCKSGSIGRGVTRTHVPFERVSLEVELMRRKGANGSLYFGESMPEEFLTIQGEVMRGFRGLELTYSDLKMPMNEALAFRSFHSCGIFADCILREGMCSRSYENLRELLDFFSDSVVEFSSFNVPVGVKRNSTVFWEVRSY